MRATVSIAISMAMAMLVMVAMCVGALAGVGGESAVASEGKPFGIEKFAMQTTGAVEVPGPLTHENWGFENRPVAFTQVGGSRGRVAVDSQKDSGFIVVS